MSWVRGERNPGWGASVMRVCREQRRGRKGLIWQVTKAGAKDPNVPGGKVGLRGPDLAGDKSKRQR